MVRSLSVAVAFSAVAGLAFAILTFSVLASDGPWPDRRSRKR